MFLYIQKGEPKKEKKKKKEVPNRTIFPPNTSSEYALQYGMTPQYKKSIFDLLSFKNGIV